MDNLEKTVSETPPGEDALRNEGGRSAPAENASPGSGGQVPNVRETSRLPAVPESREDRDRLAAAVRDQVRRLHPVPPLTLEELRGIASSVSRRLGLGTRMNDFITVLAGNEVWAETVASTPYHRRILLLPQCLRAPAGCEATRDAFGLLCEECGRCSIGTLQSEAEALGTIVLVAEGTTVVKRLLEEGKVDAVIGVGCLSALEQSFASMVQDAIPGLAFPLLYDGCEATDVDLDWVSAAVRAHHEAGAARRLDVERLREEVRSWFEPGMLRSLLRPTGSETEDIVCGWLGASGKRWRPFLAAAAFEALAENTAGSVPPWVRSVALGVECFHKASLIHDDIEDGDDYRYGAQTLHRRHGIPVAINAGDLLVGEGYRLIAESDAPAERVAAMVRIAAEGHRSLCLGQGEELMGSGLSHPLSSERQLRIFRRKTAPAFEVALRLGAVAAGAPDTVHEVLSPYSEHLGVAYQIRDDLEDFFREEVQASRADAPSSLLASMAWEAAEGSEREAVLGAWKHWGRDGEARAVLRGKVREYGVEEKVRALLEEHKSAALRSLRPLRNADLKILLSRLVGRILPRG